MADQEAYPAYITGPASANGVDPDLFARIAHIESGGDPSNRTGSYKGLFQLSNDEFNKYGGGDIYNPYHNANAAAAKIAAESAGFRDKYGRDPTPTDIYLTHQQGEGGYGAHMANPDAPAWVNMASTGEGRQKGAGWARQAIWGNIPDSYKRQFGSVDNVTSQDFVNMWRNRVEGGDTPMVSAFAADRSGALSSTPDQGLAAIATALRGKSKMADPQQPPSLAAQFLTGGPGALFGKPDTSEGGYNWGHALNNAAAWMQSLDTHGASLGAIKNSEDYALVPGPDGSVYKIHKPTGKVSTVAGPQGKIVDVGVDQGGNPIKGYQLGNRLLPISALTAGGAAGGSGSPLGQDQWLAKGVSEVDPNKQGEEYLAQYSPDVQAYVRALQEGRLPISSNARKGLAMVGNKAAAKYGEDIGVPMDATSLAERRKFATELGATANPAVFGGQRTATQTAIAHLKETLDAVDALGNSNGLGSEYLAGAVNRPMDSKFTSTDRAAKLTALLDRATAYAGERSKLLSGRAGGQEERQQIANEIFGGQKSDEALRAAVRSELQVMMGRAHPLDQKLESSNLLAPTKEKNRVIGPEQQQIIDDIIRRTSKDYVPVKGSAAAPSTWEAAQKAGWK